jgi:hypothetical protein
MKVFFIKKIVAEFICLIQCIYTTNICAYMCVAIYLLLTDYICEIKIQFCISACLHRYFIIVCLHMFDCLSQQAILDYTQ